MTAATISAGHRRTADDQRHGGKAARVGGDGAWLPDADRRRRRSGGGTGPTLMTAIRRPFEIGGHEVARHRRHLVSRRRRRRHTLLKNADMAMYRAIEGKLNGYRFFAPTMTPNWLYAGWKAIAPGDPARRTGTALPAHRRHRRPPIISLRRCCAGRATDGWSPVQFIPMAEGTGMIGPIGEWVLRQACRQMREWDRSYIPPVLVAVNLSALQLKRQDVPHAGAQDADRRNGAPPELERPKPR